MPVFSAVRLSGPGTPADLPHHGEEPFAEERIAPQDSPFVSIRSASVSAKSSPLKSSGSLRTFANA